MRVGPLSGAVLTAVVLTVANAAAIVAVRRDFPDLVARAEQVVIGTVTEVREGEDAAGAPSTFVTLEDLSVLKGDVGATLTLKFFGGRSGQTAVHIPDMPEFSPGERAVLFVAGNGRDVCPLVGIWQGRFRVRYDDTRQQEVIEDNDRLPVVGRSGRELRRATTGEAPTNAPMTLDEFRSLVADEIARPTAPQPGDK